MLLCREYYHVLFSNLRVMIESEDIIDEYFGPNGFRYDFVVLIEIILDISLLYIGG